LMLQGRQPVCHHFRWKMASVWFTLESSIANKLLSYKLQSPVPKSFRCDQLRQQNQPGSSCRETGKKNLVFMLQLLLVVITEYSVSSLMSSRHISSFELTGGRVSRRLQISEFAALFFCPSCM
ncbi:hypothetical protein T310_8623, partial [Rasamsonia emersonii CBS 393.64]